ncbi:MAG: phage portal protein [Maricaulaceae bacterium]
MFEHRRPAPDRKDSAAKRLIAFDALGRPAWSARDPATLAREGYEKNPIAHRCVRLIAEAAASVELSIEGKAASQAKALLDRPNPEQAGAELFEAFYGFLQVAGNAYLETVALDGAPRELYALRPDRMAVVPGARGWPEGWEYVLGARKVRYKRDLDTGRSPILHMRLFHPNDDHYGLSPLYVARQAVDLHNASAAWNKALLDNAARPSGALILKTQAGERLTDDQFNRLKAEFEALHQGARAAGRPLVLEGGLEWTPMALSPSDMDFIEAKHTAARDIALAFGVPPMLLGIPGDNTYANYREANLAFWRQIVLPLVKKTARALAHWFEPWFGDLRIRCDEDSVPALGQEREALWRRLNEADFLEPGERRRLAGLSPEPETTP